MRSYKFFPHVADVRLKVESDNIEELFTAALEGMGNLVKDGSCPASTSQEPKKNPEESKEKIEISSVDSTALLVDFLSEVLTYTQVNKVVYCKAKFEKLTDNFLKATIYSKKVDKFDEDIKAVTHHEAEIKKNKEGNFETIIIFDI